MSNVILANGERALLDLENTFPIKNGDIVRSTAHLDTEYVPPTDEKLIIAICDASNVSLKSLSEYIMRDIQSTERLIIVDSYAAVEEEPPTLECLFREEEPKSDKSFHKFTQTPWKRKKKGNRR